MSIQQMGDLIDLVRAGKVTGLWFSRSRELPTHECVVHRNVREDDSPSYLDHAVFRAAIHNCGGAESPRRERRRRITREVVQGSDRRPSGRGGSSSAGQPQGRQQDHGSCHEGKPGHGQGTGCQGAAAQALAMTLCSPDCLSGSPSSSKPVADVGITLRTSYRTRTLMRYTAYCIRAPLKP